MIPTRDLSGETSARFHPFEEPSLPLHGRIRDAGPGSPAAVVCHPLPLLGGTSENLVVRALCASLADAGWTTLRFDFRGAGQSGGEYSRGLGEVADVLGALRLLETLGNGAPRLTALVGYSFGAIVGLRAVFQARRAPAAYVGIAFPTDVGAVPVAGVRRAVPVDDLASLGETPCPALLVFGELDQVSHAEQIEGAWLGARAACRAEIQGADHLFRGRARKAALCARVLAFLGETGAGEDS